MKSGSVAWVVGVTVVAAISIGVTVRQGDTTDTAAQHNEKVQGAQALATRVGQILGAATACRDIARPRITAMTDMLMEVFKASTPSPDELNAIRLLYEKSLTDGQSAVTNRRTDCAAVDRNLANLEKAVTPTAPAATLSITPPASPPAPERATAVAIPSVGAPGPVSPFAQANVNIPMRGVTDTEIRFGLAAPFSGSAKELGHQMKLGIEAAFNFVNERGGIEGRQLKLVTADDGYEPARTADAMKQLYEKDQVFGIIGNVGTPTAAVALPYALEHKMLFFGAFTGANLLRRDPPDRYVFNYRASYGEETDAVVRYLVKIRRLRPEQIAVFAQQDAYGDAGFDGVAKAMRALRAGNDSPILRLNYKRNTVDVDDAVAQLRKQRTTIKAVVMVATYRAAARFIEKTHDAYPGMIYTNVSFVGSTALAEELMLLGPRYADGVIVTQVVPAVGGYSSAVLEYKNALEKYFPGEAPDYVSLEGYIAAKVLIQGLKQTGGALDTEHLIDNLEAMRNIDLGLGTSLGFGRSEHQASHKIWGTTLDENGKYTPLELD